MAKRKTKPAVAAPVRVVPPAGDDRRAWIQYQLRHVVNPKTRRRYRQVDVAREAFANEATVSLVFLGERVAGPKVDKIRRITARILGMTTDELFGVALAAGDGYPGSPGAEAHE